MKKIGLSVLFVVALAWVPLAAQESILDFSSPRLMSLGVASAGSEGPYGDLANPAASAGIQRITLDLSGFGVFDFSPGTTWAGWVNAGATFPTLGGNLSVVGHFGSSPFANLNFGTVGGLNLAFSKDLLPDLDFGVGLGFQIGQVPVTNAIDWGLGLDLGFIHKIDPVLFLRDFRWGVALRNLGKGLYTPFGALPPNFTPAVGTQFKFIKTEEFNLGFTADLAFPSFQNFQFNAGLEFVILKLISLQVSYDFDLVQRLNTDLPAGYDPSTAITRATARPLPISIGISVFLNPASQEAGAAKDVPFYQNSEYNASVVVSPLGSSMAAIGIGLNMPIGVIDKQAPALEIGDPLFEDQGLDVPLAPGAPAPADSQPASSTSSAWVEAYLPVGAETVAPAGGSGSGGSPAAPQAAGVPAPQASSAPVVDPSRASGLATGNPVYISPNFDGVRDALTLPLTIKDDRPVASFTLYITDDKGKVVRTIRNKDERPETVDIGKLFDRLFRLKTGLTVPKSLVWDGRSDAGVVVADGLYAYQVEAADDNGNTAKTSLRPVIVDTRAPQLDANSNAPSFAPGGDRPVLVFSLESGETLAPIDSWAASVTDKDGALVRSWTWKDKLPTQTIWDGKTDTGILSNDGIYTFHLATVDRAGNRSAVEVPNLLLLNKPTPINLTIDNAYFSPNNDGIKDQVIVAIEANDQVKVNSWSARLFNSKGNAVRSFSGSDALPKTILINGMDDANAALPEDVYKLTVSAIYENGNNPVSDSPQVTLDLTKPNAKVSLETGVFSPNGDGYKDTLVLRQSASNEPQWEGRISNADGKRIRTFTWRDKPDETVAWDGRDATNALIGDGPYTYQVTATDLAGNVGISAPVIINVDNRATGVSIRAIRPAFAPSTDSQFKTMTLELDQKLNEGIVSWNVRILRLSPEQAKTGLNPELTRGAPQVAGFNAKGNPKDQVIWDGKAADGAMAPDGPYIAEYTVVYEKGDQPQAWTVPFSIKNRKPSVKLEADNPFFSPDGDGKQDTITFLQTTSEEESWTGTISDTKDNIIKTVSWSGSAVPRWVWDGTDKNGNKVPDGEYRYFLATQDSAGNKASAAVTPIRLQTVKPELSLAISGAAFSPKAGSAKPTMEFKPSLKLNSDNDIKDWKLQVNPLAGGNARNISGAGKVPETLLWDGKTDGGRVAPEGDYLAVLTVNFKSGQSPVATSPKFALDTTAPNASVFADPVLFSPNGDGLKDATTIKQELSKELGWKATISFATPPAGASDPVLRSFSWNGNSPATLNWDGTNSQGVVVPDGRYLYQLESVDAAGNAFESAPIEIRVDNRVTPIAIKADKRWFSPSGDAKNRQVFTPTVILSEGIEAWQLDVRAVSDANGPVVKSFKGTNTPPASLEWDGKTDSGGVAADGDFVAAFTVSYLKGNKPVVRTDVFTMDSKAPNIKISADDLIFSPDPESKRAALRIKQDSSAEEVWEGTMLNSEGKPVKSWFWKGEAQDFAWDGRDENGNLQKDGQYRYVVSASDKAGNTTRQELKGITIDTRPTPLLLIADAKGFAPGTGRAAVSTIGFKPMITLTEGVTGWTLSMVNQSQGNKAERTFSGSGLPPASWTWDGLRDDKSRAPEGKYEAVLVVEYKKGNKPEARTNSFVLDTSAPKAQMRTDPIPFSPDEDGIDDEVTIGIAVDDQSPIKDWSLEILDPQGMHFVTFSGSGTPTSRIVWNGHSDSGELVQAALDYIAVLKVKDSLGNEGSYRQPVPVDVLVLRDGNDLRIRIPGISFPANSSDLNSKDLKPEQLAQNAKTLDRLAEILRKYGSYQIVVEGHANITQYWSAAEADKENRTELQPLSEKRAQAVKEALAKRGIAASRLSIVGVGGSRPVVQNNDLANVWKNRRVEFILRK